MAKYSPLFIKVGPGISMMIGLPTVPTWDSESRPKKAGAGTLGFNTETNTLEYWSGTDWFSAKLS